MYIFQHAMKNIGRNKGRNLLMGIIVLVIIIATVISLIINNTSGRIIDDYKTQFGSKVSIAPDLEQMYNKGQITKSHIGAIFGICGIRIPESKHLFRRRAECQ